MYVIVSVSACNYKLRACNVCVCVGVYTVVKLASFHMFNLKISLLLNLAFYSYIYIVCICVYQERDTGAIHADRFVIMINKVISVSNLLRGGTLLTRT